jgi:ketosteroid isomerase-like protein
MPDIEHPILELDRARREACVASDTSTIERFTSADCVYVHSSGQVETRDEMVGRFRDGSLVYRTLDVVKASVRDYGDVVLVNGDMHIDVTTNGSVKDFVARYLQVWRRNDGGWQMISWQSTPLPS